ncbi:MAG: hypothetical protein NTX61_08345 [Bacteroidetes bacterium]|nr:hypothetical protein [Bacteroidota bacterium]
MISVLFARKRSIYKTIPDCDVWDIIRDARKWPGGNQVITHPPCRAWGKLRGLANSSEDEKDLAFFAVNCVRNWGGVLEHPLGSKLWDVLELPYPGKIDEFGGWTLAIDQFWFGHRAKKGTFLYIVGTAQDNIPDYSLRFDMVTHVISTSKRIGGDSLKDVNKTERERTPLNLALWLVKLAERCKV